MSTYRQLSDHLYAVVSSLRATLQTRPFYFITVIRTVTWKVIGSFCPVALYNNFVRDINAYNVMDVWTWVFTILAIICLVPLRLSSGTRPRITRWWDNFVNNLIIVHLLGFFLKTVGLKYSFSSLGNKPNPLSKESCGFIGWHCIWSVFAAQRTTKST